eukprot:4570859-Prymnesium_polylepis.1
MARREGAPSHLVVVGIIVPPSFSPATAAQKRSILSSVPLEWRFVTAEQRHASLPDFVVVPCRDGPWHHLTSQDDRDTAKATACSCKTVLWYHLALSMFPKAAYIAKVEDDTLLHDARLVAELAHAAARYSRRTLVWYSMFGWGGIDASSGRNAWWCGHGDRLVLRSAPAAACPQPPIGRAPQIVPSNRTAYRTLRRKGLLPSGPLVSPFATGPLEARSRSLAALVSGCAHTVAFTRAWAEGAHGGCEDYRRQCADDEWALACDGWQGYLVAACLRQAALDASVPNVSLTLLHLPFAKVHAPMVAARHQPEGLPRAGPA